MKIFQFKLVFYIFIILVCTPYHGLAEVNSLLSQINIQTKSFFDNIFESAQIFHAEGFIQKLDTNLKLSEDNKLMIIGISVKFDNNMLHQCDYSTTESKILSEVFNNSSEFDAIEMVWRVTCDIPSSFDSGTYSVKIDIEQDSGVTATIYQGEITYESQYISIIADLFIIIVFLLLLIFKLKLPNYLKYTSIFLLLILSLISFFSKNIYLTYGGMFYIFLIIILYYLRPQSEIHSITFERITFSHKFYIILLMSATIFACVKPMSLSPHFNQNFKYNGYFVDKREQYSALAKSFLEGRLSIDYGNMDSKLVEMDNPYDPVKRKQDNIQYPVDHALYKGKFYVYFGVVPAIFVFMPYQIITGHLLHNYQAVQLFVAFSIIGIFSLYYLYSKIIFKKMTLGMYLGLSITFAVISIWYCICFPVIYLAAISSGVCFEVWSIYFFSRSFLLNLPDQKKLQNIFWGAVFGALVFGCRPPIALANILFIPTILLFFKSCPKNKLKNMALLTSPYITVIALLMLYNYMRFDNPFEFGLSYMLAIEDLHNYASYVSENLNLHFIIKKLHAYFLQPYLFNSNFPYINYSGVFFNFPLLLTYFLIFTKSNITFIYRSNLKIFISFLFIASIIISVFDSIAVTYISEGYRMDFYYIICISCFISIGIYIMQLTKNKQKIFSYLFTIASLLTLCYIVLLVLVPARGNFADCFHEINNRAFKILSFGACDSPVSKNSFDARAFLQSVN